MANQPSFRVAESDPVISVDDALLRHLETGKYVATIEPTRRLSYKTLDKLYDKTLAALHDHVDVGVTLKLLQHVRANLEHYVAYFAAKERVAYFCTDHLEEAIRIRLILRRLGRSQKILLLYACSPEFADLYVAYEIEPCVFDPWWIEQAIRHKTSPDESLRVHLWVDVGMGREGLLPTDIDMILPALRRPEIVVQGLATHINMVLQDRAIQQSRFEEVRQTLTSNGIRPRTVHAVASHNGLGYNDMTGSLSVECAAADLFYDMVRPGSSLGLGPRFGLTNRHEEVLRITIPIREARIAHVKRVPPGWNLGYWSNNLQSGKRIAVLEGTRLIAIGQKEFLRRSRPNHERVHSILTHARIACVELEGGDWHAGDQLSCETTIWISFLTKSFARSGDDGILISLLDARTGLLRSVAITVDRRHSNERLLEHIDRFVTGLLMRRVERLGSRHWTVRVMKRVLVSTTYVTLRIIRRIPLLAGFTRSLLAPIASV